MNDNLIPLNALNKFTIGILLLAITPLPYSYYMFLRWAVMLSTCIHLYFAFKRKCWAGIAIFVVIASLFNPFEPVYLTKSVWVFLDFFAAVFMAVGFEDLSKKTDSTEVAK